MIEDIIVSGGAIVAVIFFILLLVFLILYIIRKEYLRKIRVPDVLLAIDVPRENEKTPLAAEQMFNSLHGLYRNKLQRLLYGDRSISFEIEAKKGSIRFYCHVPGDIKEFVSKQIYAQYPDVKITEVEDYVRLYDLDILEREMAIARVTTNKSFVYPIRTFPNFEVDPLAAITSSLSELNDKEEIWFQMVILPLSNTWQNSAHQYVDDVRAGRSNILGGVALGIVSEIFAIFFVYLPRVLAGKSGTPDKPKEVKISDTASQALKMVEEKSTKMGFSVQMRLIGIAPTKERATSRLEEFVATLQQFNMTHLNGFKLQKRIFNVSGFKEYFKQRRAKRKGVILNTEELASVFHLPNQTVETPSIVWSRARKGEPPANLPVTGEEGTDNRALTIFADTDFRHEERKFGIKQKDRLRHMYVIGKTGMGKSTMLSNMAIDDIRSGRGIALIDPHGDLFETVLDYIPKKRINDVVLFNPADRDFPVAMNLLESVNDSYKTLVASGLIAVFYKMYADSWGPRLEHILRNTILALLDAEGSTLLGIPRMLVDKRYRKGVVSKITNPTVRMFWDQEFTKIETSRAAAEALGAVQNKVGQFLSTPIVRNIVGQRKSTIDFRQIMDDSKILLVNLSKGLIGEDVSSLLGSMLISKIQLAAMSRSDMLEEERIPFHLFVDEFQNFATISFASILSEARKFKLGLTMANQYISQMPEEVRDAVFGNVGTLISFAIGATDAKYIASEFNPVFTEDDLVHLDKYNIYLRMTIDGINSEPFSASTLPLPTNMSGQKDKILKVSRERYSKPADVVEDKIEKWSGFQQLQEGESVKVVEEAAKPKKAKQALPAQTHQKKGK